MSSYTRISRAFTNACPLPLHQRSKYVVFSDCHRGTGKTNDNFLKNEFLYLAALKYYFQSGFTYLELGDGDELWENRSFEAIKQTHPNSFDMLAKFRCSHRFYAVYGNHDIIKRSPVFSKKYCQHYYCEQTLCHQPLFPDMRFYSGIILKDCEQNTDIYLTHGHQADILNSTLWPLSRFLVRYVWKPLELLGVPDPTSAAQNHRKKKISEKRLADWAKNNHHILITGHTHHPMVGSKTSPYFNTGSCISPSGITCIEIEKRCLSLVKWSIGTKADLRLYAQREILGNTVCIDDYIEP
ncbi:MAG: metallophosphoesterase family protein [Lachnospiraceae bacterium]|nr:metallophosphoesterase family protein [Lachnospiraceae bacterium]